MNRKGMIAMMDAMIFIVLIAFVSMAIMNIESENHDHEPLDASEICEYILSTDVTGSDLIPEMGSTRYTMADAVAYAVVKDHEPVMKELKTMLDDMTMGNYDYVLRLTCENVTKTIGGLEGVSESTYSGTWTVSGGRALSVEMWLT